MITAHLDQRRDDVSQRVVPLVRRRVLDHLSWGVGTCHYCRGAWARVTIVRLWHLSLSWDVGTRHYCTIVAPITVVRRGNASLLHDCGVYLLAAHSLRVQYKFIEFTDHHSTKLCVCACDRCGQMPRPFLHVHCHHCVLQRVRSWQVYGRGGARGVCGL